MIRLSPTSLIPNNHTYNTKSKKPRNNLSHLIQILFALLIVILVHHAKLVSAKVDCAKECPCGVPSLEVPDQWLEVHVAGSFKVWHIIFIIIFMIVITTIVYCCFHRCRIPRTKQEIEADSMRSNLAKKFREHLQELPVEQTSFLDALKKVQELEEIKLQNDNDDGGGARKRLGWLKMLGKVETINKEDGDNIDLEKQLKEKTAEEEKNRLLAALSDPKNLTHLSKVESKDTDKLITAVENSELAESENIKQELVTNGDINVDNAAKNKGIETSAGQFRKPEESTSVKELRIKKGRGDQLNKAEKKRLDQADKELKKAIKEAKKLAKLERKLKEQKELKAREEAKEKERLELLEQKKRLKEEKKKAKKSPKQDINRKSSQDKIQDNEKTTKEVQPKNSEVITAAESNNHSVKDTEHKIKSKDRPRHIDKFETNNVRSRARNKSRSNHDANHSPDESRHHQRKKHKHETTKFAEADHQHHHVDRSKLRKHERKDAKSKANKGSPSEHQILDHTDGHELGSLDRKSKQEEIKRILNLPHNLNHAQLTNEKAKTKDDIRLSNRESVRTRTKTHAPRSQSHYDESFRTERSIRNVNQEQAQSLNRDNRHVGEFRHHDRQYQQAQSIQHIKLIQPSQLIQTTKQDQQTYKASQERVQPSKSRGKDRQSIKEIKEIIPEQMSVAPLVTSEVANDENIETPRPLLGNTSHLERPKPPEMVKVVSPTRLSKMVGRRLILDAVTRPIQAPKIPSTSTSSRHYHNRQQQMHHKGDRSKLKERVSARNNKDDVTIEIVDPGIREIYETRIDMEKLREFESDKQS